MEINEFALEIKPKRKTDPGLLEKRNRIVSSPLALLCFGHILRKRGHGWLVVVSRPTSCEHLGGNGLPMLLLLLSEAREEEQGSGWGESLTTDHIPLQKWLGLRTWQLNY